MNKTIRYVAGGAVLAALASACNGSTASNSANVETPAGFCDALLDAVVTWSSGCLEGPADVLRSTLYTQQNCSAFVSAVSTGRVKFVAANAPACIASVEQMACGDGNNGAGVPAACDSTYPGMLATGATCWGDGDCAGEAFCNFQGNVASDGGCSSGVCAPAIPLGAACTPYGGTGTYTPCVSGAECSGSPGTCVAIPASTGIAKGGACSPTQPNCGSRLACDSVTSTCEPVIAEGGACTPGHFLCEPYTSCDATTKTCKRWPGSAGATCGNQTGGDPVSCLPPNVYCNIAAGGVAGACATSLADGAPCTDYSQCLSQNCGGTSGTMTCVPNNVCPGI